jgi:hypothetical protein
VGVRFVLQERITRKADTHKGRPYWFLLGHEVYSRHNRSAFHASCQSDIFFAKMKQTSGHIRYTSGALWGFALMNGLRILYLEALSCP